MTCLQFDFSEDAVKKLDEIQGHLKADSRAEVVRRALALMDYLTRREARILVKFEGEETQTFLIPGGF